MDMVITKVEIIYIKKMNNIKFSCNCFNYTLRKLNNSGHNPFHEAFEDTLQSINNYCYELSERDMKTMYLLIITISSEISILTGAPLTVFWSELIYNHSLKEEISTGKLLINLLLWLSHSWLLSPGLTNCHRRFILLTENNHNFS